jgi:membrane-bound lytic murein transglycosylase C
MRYAVMVLVLLGLLGCARSDYVNIAQAALSKDPASAAKILARSKVVHYGTNPEKLASDLKNFDANLRTLFAALFQEVAKEWGEENVEESEETKTVKYLQDFQSRVLIDFDKGEVQVETVALKDPKTQLKEAIVMALLMPEDPRQVDLFSSQAIELGKTPYLYEEVLDDTSKPIRWEWRANRYADILLENALKTRQISRDNKPLTVRYVTIPMVKNHASVRVNKIAPLVKAYASRYKLSEVLVYAIIRTESNFNQYAISRSGAVGLMQIMSQTAGKDAYKELTGKTWAPTREYLYDAKNNIELGTTYLHILMHRYLSGIAHPLSHEYCVISAYNGGAGTVLRAFNTDRAKAKTRINALTPAQVYQVLREEVAFEETRAYLKKVLTYKKEFIGIR